MKFNIPLNKYTVSVFALSLVFSFYQAYQATILDLDSLHVLGDSTHSAIDVKFYTDRDFYKGVFETKDNKYESSPKIKGGIIPHHLLPGFLLSDFFMRVAVNHPKKVILLGPNHHETGAFHIVSTDKSWNTKFGIVDSDVKTLNGLKDNNFIGFDDAVLENEHSVSGIMPYIKYYLPDAEVVPLVISAKTPKEELLKLGEQISVVSDEDTIVIAAVDFSHYLINEKAQEKDKITKEALENFNYDQLLLFNNDNTDSSHTLVAFLAAMKKMGAEKNNIINNINSGVLLENNTVSTTSYFEIEYY